VTTVPLEIWSLPDGGVTDQHTSAVPDTPPRSVIVRLRGKTLLAILPAALEVTAVPYAVNS
jgi:hypothetical protein